MSKYYENFVDIWDFIGKNISDLYGDYDCEFDWIGRDCNDYIGIFISFNRGFIPKDVYSSLELYSRVMEIIEFLPLKNIGKGLGNNKDDEFSQMAQKGMFVYDNHDVHNVKKLEQYDIIHQPNIPITLEKAGLTSYSRIIPKFNLNFGKTVKFKELMNSIVSPTF